MRTHPVNTAINSLLPAKVHKRGVTCLAFELSLPLLGKLKDVRHYYITNEIMIETELHHYACIRNAHIQYMTIFSSAFLCCWSA